MVGSSWDWWVVALSTIPFAIRKRRTVANRVYLFSLLREESYLLARIATILVDIVFPSPLKESIHGSSLSLILSSLEGLPGIVARRVFFVLVASWDDFNFTRFFCHRRN